MTPAPLDVRVARVIAAPVPFLAYFLIRVPQVTEGGYVPWAEAVPITILTMALFPMWLYWCADLISWRRDRPTLTADEFDATEGAFAGELPDVAQALPKGADGKFAAVPVHRATNYLAQSQLYAREWAEKQHEKLINAGAVTADGETYLFGTGAHRRVEQFWNDLYGGPPTDDRPTEPLLLTHEFTPAAGIRMDVTGGNEWLESNLAGDPFTGNRVVVRGGRHRARTHLPPIAEVENADAYSQLNRTRELPF